MASVPLCFNVLAWFCGADLTGRGDEASEKNLQASNAALRSARSETPDLTPKSPH